MLKIKNIEKMDCKFSDGNNEYILMFDETATTDKKYVWNVIQNSVGTFAPIGELSLRREQSGFKVFLDNPPYLMSFNGDGYIIHLDDIKDKHKFVEKVHKMVLHILSKKDKFNTVHQPFI